MSVAFSGASRGREPASHAGFLDGGPPIPAPGPQFSASLERGLAILEGFEGRKGLLGVAEMAGRLRMSRSTTHRYVITLQALGYLEQGDHRRYGPTLGVTKLGCSSMSATSLPVQARSLMQELARQTGFVVDLGILDGPEVLLVERIAGRRRGSAGGALEGELRLPMHCTAMGKLLLAMLPDDVGHEFLTQLVLERCAPNTIRTKRALRDELAGVRENGIAVCDGELSSDLVEIAAAVRDERGDIRAALGLSTGASKITAETLASALGPHLLSTANQISARLGYRRADERARLSG
jgi:IclR family pca regulon transcriptional regulator